ncbi:MAG TPA: hypothetical protein VF717_19720 [Pyrinomonadaceae bacterium]|jgi:hypothetical protein
MKTDHKLSEPASASEKPGARLTNVLGKAHLVYLGLLPSFATFALLYTYGHPAPLLLFLGGTVAVSVYLAVIISYTRIPSSSWLSLFIILDGPAWVMLSLLYREMRLPVFAIEGFLVDGTAIWLSTLILALRSDKPTPGQRAASVGFMLVALAATASLVWPYLRAVLWGEWLSLSWLGMGIVEALIVNYKLLERDEIVRNSDYASVYIAVLVMVWVGSLLGNAFH